MTDLKLESSEPEPKNRVPGLDYTSFDKDIKYFSNPVDVIHFEDPKCSYWLQEDVKSENTGWVDKEEHHKKKKLPKERHRSTRRVNTPRTK